MSDRKVFLNCAGNGVVPVSVAIYSLLKHARNDRPLSITVCHDAAFVAAGGRERVREVVARFPFASVAFMDFMPTLMRYRDVLVAGSERWTPLVWAWCFCTELLPDATGNLVFIDWDMLVREDLEYLFTLDLKKGHYISAAVNESRREHRAYLVNAGWPEEAGYAVNTGLQVIDLDAFRREKITEKILAWYTRYRAVSECVEQDALNAVVGARILRLDMRYNFTVGWLDRLVKMNPFAREWRVYPPREVLAACLDPAILHFIGHKKPWRWNHRPYRQEYRQAMAELGFLEANGRLPEETPVRRLVGALFDFYHRMLLVYARLCGRFLRCAPKVV